MIVICRDCERFIDTDFEQAHEHPEQEQGAATQYICHRCALILSDEYREKKPWKQRRKRRKRYRPDLLGNEYWKRREANRELNIGPKEARIYMAVDKGLKESAQRAAKKEGLSLQDYIARAILQRLYSSVVDE